MENEKQEIKEEGTDPIAKAEAAAQRLQDANKKYEELLNREADLQARRILGGKSDLEAKPEAKKETAKEYAARVMSNKV